MRALVNGRRLWPVFLGVLASSTQRLLCRRGIALFLWSWRAGGRDPGQYMRRNSAHDSCPTMQPGWMDPLLRTEVCKQKWQSPLQHGLQRVSIPLQSRRALLTLRTSDSSFCAQRSSSLPAPGPPGRLCSHLCRFQAFHFGKEISGDWWKSGVHKGLRTISQSS